MSHKCKAREVFAGVVGDDNATDQEVNQWD